MTKRTLVPSPLDTSDVQLPESVAALTEQLAQQVHRIWAAGRYADGWTWGPHRDDDLKQHPCLVPYDQLPESEKGYDRRTSLQTLKTVFKLGYKIESQHEAAMVTHSRIPVEELHASLKTNELPLIEVFKRLILEDDEKFWLNEEDFHCDLVQALTGAGHATAAYDYATRALSFLPGSLWLGYRQALALARGRSVRRARSLVERLLDRLESDKVTDRMIWVEALSLAGRLFKDLGRTTGQKHRRKRYFESARQRYAKAYELAEDWFPGINAATTALLAGVPDQAEQIANQVIRQASGELDRLGNSDDYWLLATLAEAHLICQRYGKATDLYQRAVRLAQGRIGDIASMRRNVELLDECLQVPKPLLDCFEFGNVIVFAGHMIDHPDRTAKRGLEPRFPPIHLLEKRLAQAIASEIRRIDPVVGYCSLANGADILFAEQMFARGSELHVVLPFDLEDFWYTSVTFGIRELAEWRRRADRILAQSQVHYATRERFLGDDVLFEFTNRIMQGMAVLRAEEFGVTPHALVAFDRDKVAGGKAGTSAFFAKWAAGDREVTVIDIGELREALPSSAKPRQLGPPQAPPPVQNVPSGRRRVAYMLFSDIQNFSRIKEEDSPAFLTQFMRIVKSVMRDCRRPPSFTNTWGDALYMVFDSAVDCADFAMRLLRRMDKVDWTRHNLPADTAMRIGLHAGPVYRRRNAILERMDVFGSHVNLAARIEPVTTPGSAWVSQHFAAELAVETDHPFTCDYIGVQELPKRSGQATLYRLDQR